MRRVLGRVAVVAVAVVAACERPIPLGDEEECVFNDDCIAGLLCAGGRCRTVCRDDRDCTGGWRCRVVGEPTRRACLPPDDLGYCRYDSDCGEPLLCAAGRCVPQATVREDCAGHHPGLVAVPSDGGFVCRWPADLTDAGRAP